MNGRRCVPAYRGAALVVVLGAVSNVARADADPGASVTLPDVVVATSPLPGPTIDIDKVPGLVQSVGSDTVTLAGAAGLNGALAARLASVNLNDNSGSVFQPDVLYRGFAASPVLGTPQGLAVYQNGVRINEAFGDAVNWDLIPDLAIDRIDVVSANPVYGLNALGGGISIRMKDGFRYHGAEADLSGGSFREHSAALEAGANNGRFAIYGAARGLDRAGWRRQSDERIRQLYLVASERTATASIDLAYTHAANDLAGQGAAPVQELALDRTQVYTGPQGCQDRVDLLALNVAWRATDAVSLQGALYGRWFGQRIDNGNRTSYVRCAADVAPGFLCQGDGQTVLVGANGAELPDPAGGAAPLGENDRERIDAVGRGAALQLTSTGGVAGHTSALTVGLSIDHASVAFGSSVEVGPLDAQLRVVPTGLYVATLQSSEFAATPVALRAVHTYLGGYATETLDLTPAVALTASGRYNVARLELHDLVGSALTGSSRYVHFNPAIGFTWRWRPTITAYAGIASNTRAPTASEIECSDPARPCLLPSTLAGDPPALRQVVARTTEAGLRGRVRGGNGWHVAWHAAAFRTELDDDIYGVATGTGAGYFRNIGSTRRQGLEAGLEAEHGRWSGFATYARVDATFESPLTLPSPANPLADAAGDIVVRPGDRLPGLPRDRIKAGITRGLGDRGSIGLSVVAVGSSFLRGDEANGERPLPGHAVVGLRAEYRAGERITLYGRIENALDARYSTFGLYADPSGLGVPGVPVAGADPRFENPAAPRALFAGIRIRL
jgi:iron complex outermembrane receptor protein